MSYHFERAIFSRWFASTQSQIGGKEPRPIARTWPPPYCLDNDRFCSRWIGSECKAFSWEITTKMSTQDSLCAIIALRAHSYNYCVTVIFDHRATVFFSGAAVATKMCKQCLYPIYNIITVEKSMCHHFFLVPCVCRQGVNVFSKSISLSASGCLSNTVYIGSNGNEYTTCLRVRAIAWQWWCLFIVCFPFPIQRSMIGLVL